MGKLLTGILFVSSTIIACSTPTNKKMIKNTQQVETKTNTSSSAAKANEPGDSVVIKPVHKYKHHRKLKLK